MTASKFRMWSSGSVVPSYASKVGGFSIPRGRRALLILSDKGLRNSSSSLALGEIERVFRRVGSSLRGFLPFLMSPLSSLSGEGLSSSMGSGLRFFLLFRGGERE